MPILDYSESIVENGDFTWHEYALLPSWNAYAIPSDTEVYNARVLFRHVQEYIRTPINKPMGISSGARTREYTKYLRSMGYKAAMQSAHIEWKAGDFPPPAGMSNREWWQYWHERWPGRLENLRYTPGWVHADTRNWGLRQRFRP